MTEFKPPISERETEALIEIANCNDENSWQREATLQAKQELIKRNVSQKAQNEVIERWNKKAELLFKKEAIRLEKNETESYLPWEMIVLFLFGPLLLIRPYLFNSHSIFTLRSENYYLKFKQRIVIFLLSFIAWYFYINYSYKKSEQKRLEEIDKIDISDWKKFHGYD